MVENSLGYTSKPGKQLGHSDLSTKGVSQSVRISRHFRFNCFRKKESSGQIHLGDIVEI